MGWSQAGHVVTLTYNVNKRLTSAFVQGPRDAEFFKRVNSHLRGRPDLVNQPAFLLLVTAQVEYDAIDNTYNKYRNENAQHEEDTGYGRLMSKATVGSKDAAFSIDQALPAMTKALNDFKSKILGQTERVQSCLLRHEIIMVFLDATTRFVPDDSVEGHSAAQAREMKQHAEYLANSWKCLQARYDAFERNMHAIIAVVCDLNQELKSLSS